jgi:hypothetical protein
VEKLIVPLTLKETPFISGLKKTLITRARIDYSQRWQKNHLRTIESAYRKAPYFEHYWDDLKNVFVKQHEFLYDLNFDLLRICFRWLGLNKAVLETALYNVTPDSSVRDFRNKIHPKKSIDSEFFIPVPYPQVFGNTFMPNLSVIDLVFCMGPNANRVMADSAQRA